MNITIRVPKNKNDRWVVSNHYRRKSINTLLKLIEKQIIKATAKGNVCIYVNYGDGEVNETIPSKNKDYLIYATACFLEDYMSEETLKKYEDLYAKKYL